MRWKVRNDEFIGFLGFVGGLLLAGAIYIAFVATLVLVVGSLVKWMFF